MPFDQSSIIGGPWARPLGAELLVSWASSEPWGAVFQLYADGRLVWAGRARSCLLPPAYRRSALRVGVVPASEFHLDFAPGLPAVPGEVRRPELKWYGGRYLAPTIRGFRVYQGTAPGAPVGTVPVADLPAYPRGRYNDGFGQGPFGYGGFGTSASSYRWVGPPLADGAWNFSIVPYDDAGSLGGASAGVVTIAAAPAPPAGLSYSYDVTTRQVTLSWS